MGIRHLTDGQLPDIMTQGSDFELPFTDLHTMTKSVDHTHPRPQLLRRG